MKSGICASLVLSLAAVSAFAGVSYTFESSTSGVGEMVVSGTAESDGPKMRIRFVHAGGNLFPDGSLAVTTDGGKSLTFLDPKEKTFYVVQVEDLFARLGVEGLIKASSSMVKMTEGGPGPAIEGMPTRVVHINVAFDMEVGSAGKTHFTMTGDAFLTDAVPAGTSSFIGMKGVRSGIPAVDQLIEAQSTVFRSSFLLKETLTISAKGGLLDYDSVTAAAIHNVKVHDIPPSDFTVPPEFTRVESPMDKLAKAR